MLKKLNSYIQSEASEFTLGNVNSVAAAYLLQTITAKQNAPIICITDNTQDIENITDTFQFLNLNHLPVLHFPNWETLPYDRLSPHKAIISERLSTLYQLPFLKKGVLITSINTVMHRLLPKNYLQAHGLKLKVNEHLCMKTFRAQLIEASYHAAEQVMEHGEFAVRGSIIDIYPMGSKTPYRIEWFDDVIESIRSFDPDTQISSEKFEAINLLPGDEYPLNENNIETFRSKWREKFDGNPNHCPIYTSISNGKHAAGAEYYLPLFYPSTSTFFDYLPKNTIFVFLNDVEKAAHHFFKDIQTRYQQLSADLLHPLCTPEELFVNPNNFFEDAKSFKTICFTQNTQQHNFETKTFPDLKINYKDKHSLKNLNNFIQTYAGRILFCTETAGRREILLDLLRQIHLLPKQYQNWQAFLDADDKIGMVIAPMNEGLMLDEVALISEPQLFGERVLQKRRRAKQAVNPNALIQNLNELKIGDPVVHLDHGVGRYQGLSRLKTQEHDAEYITLAYAHDDKIYAPITSLHLITRYTGADADHVALNTLGTRQWEKTKERALKRIHDVAAELLDIYSKRQASLGFSFKLPRQEFDMFSSSFPFEETIDQLQSIDETINDMQKPNSMDRLICGDVGFGKTEVAMRAAFIATQNLKQVAVLVPTTLLASQHLQTFHDRFANWPIVVDGLFRFKTKTEQNKIIEKLNAGKIDIIIGTHKLLDPKIKFKDLGLLIIDEEHRFGVRQKEKIKALRAHVDILTLTATPIPRTLNLALSGTRDLSIITTPPAKRLAIKTFVRPYDENAIREALLREMMRGGQAYFLHNDVASIHTCAERLMKLLPNLRVAVAHGQMHEKELEQVMTAFYHQQYQVLVCSTIIESGIDIPTANTMIIERADKFGLAQLHQLRGRVGRSHHQAYAYLLTPERGNITPDARKRLEAISQLEDLGAGFYLANQDLEIRGAGEILGEEQSGHMEAIGFSLYMELLEEAVKALKEGAEPSLDISKSQLPDIDLKVTALLPDTYVYDVNIRLVFYKRLSGAKTSDDIDQLKIELIDRFGLLPNVAQNLIEISKLKLTAKTYGISKITANKDYLYLNFKEPLQINVDHLIKVVQLNAKTHQLRGTTLRIKHETKKDNARIAKLKDSLKKLMH